MAGEDRAAVREFAGRARAVPNVTAVVTKHDLLRGHDLKMLKTLAPEQQAAVDFLVLNLKFMNPDGMEDDGLEIEDTGLEIDLDEPYNILEVSDSLVFYALEADFVSRACPSSKPRSYMMTSRNTCSWNSRKSI